LPFYTNCPIPVNKAPLANSYSAAEEYEHKKFGRQVMFGIFKSKKTSSKNFEFHKDRMRKLLEKAHDRFDRADRYLTGEGFGGVTAKTSAAQGAIGKGHSALKEAIWNAQEAIKYGNNEQEKILRIKSVIDEFTETNGEELFAHPSVIEVWDAAMKQWNSEFNKLL
jgi:hypothetical protein